MSYPARNIRQHHNASRLPEPGDIAEAYDRFYQLTSEVQTIETQLNDQNRSRNFDSIGDYRSWRRKASVAMSLKLKQIQETKKWINANGGNLPTEEDDNIRPENITLSNNQRVTTDRRPDPDRVIDNVCGAVLQLRSLKRRLYPFYKIANAAFDVAQEYGVDIDDPSEEMNQMIYWLGRAGYNIEQIDGYDFTNEVPGKIEEGHEEDWEDIEEDYED